MPGLRRRHHLEEHSEDSTSAAFQASDNVLHVGRAYDANSVDSFPSGRTQSFCASRASGGSGEGAVAHPDPHEMQDAVVRADPLFVVSWRQRAPGMTNGSASTWKKSIGMMWDLVAPRLLRLRGAPWRRLRCFSRSRRFCQWWQDAGWQRGALLAAAFPTAPDCSPQRRQRRGTDCRRATPGRGPASPPAGARARAQRRSGGASGRSRRQRRPEAPAAGAATSAPVGVQEPLRRTHVFRQASQGAHQAQQRPGRVQ